MHQLKKYFIIFIIFKFSYFYFFSKRANIRVQIAIYPFYIYFFGSNYPFYIQKKRKEKIPVRKGHCTTVGNYTKSVEDRDLTVGPVPPSISVQKMEATSGRVRPCRVCIRTPVNSCLDTSSLVGWRRVRLIRMETYIYIYTKIEMTQTD